MIRASFFTAITVLCLGLAALPAQNNRKGGGGGGTPPPAGTIYFSWNDPATPEGVVLHSMDAAGNNKTALVAGVDGEPSYLTYPGLGRQLRWFLEIQGNELWAVAEDLDLSTSPPSPYLRSVRLTFFNGALNVVGTPRWSKGNDVYLAFLTMDPVTNDQRVWRHLVAWIGGQPSLGDFVDWPLTSTDILGGYDRLRSFDFDSTGLQVLFSATLNNEGWCSWRVKDLTSGGVGPEIIFGSCDASLAPDGTRIVFSSGYDLHTIQPDGSGDSVIVRGRSSGYGIVVRDARWSPDGAYLFYLNTTLRCCPSTTIADLYRATASGGQKTKLTGDLQTHMFNAPQPVAWR